MPGIKQKCQRKILLLEILKKKFKLVQPGILIDINEFTNLANEPVVLQLGVGLKLTFFINFRETTIIKALKDFNNLIKDIINKPPSEIPGVTEELQ